MHIEDYLYYKDLYLPLGGKVKKLTNTTDPEWEILHKKALGSIRLYLETLMAFNISKEKTTIGLMTALNKLYKKPSTSKKLFLIKNYLIWR